MSEKNLNRIRALRPLASRDYRLLFAAVGIEVFGTGMWTIVMVFQVLALDDSPLALSGVALSPIGSPNDASSSPCRDAPRL